MLEQLKEVLSGLKQVKLLTWLSLAIATALLVVIGAWLSSWGFRVIQDWANLQHNPTDATKKQFDASLEIVKAIVGSIGTLATIAGGIILYLNFRVANKNAETAIKTVEIANQNAVIANRTVELAESRLITERFSKAVEQLGSDKIEVRLGGIYSLERIAQDSERDHWTIMEVLTAFVREKSPVELAQPKMKASFVEHYLQSETEEAEGLQVTKDVQAALTVIGRREGEKDQKKYLDLSLSNLHFANLSKFDLNNANLRDANLSRADLNRANLNGADLDSADLSRADLSFATLIGADLGFATLIGARLSRADLSCADLSFTTLTGADLVSADLSGATLGGADLSFTTLIGTNLSGAILGSANLSKSTGLTEEQLKEAKLCHTLMPDGTISDRDCKNSS